MRDRIDSYTAHRVDSPNQKLAPEAIRRALIIRSLQAAAEKGLGARLAHGELQDNRYTARSFNDKVIGEYLAHTTLHYGFMEAFNDPSTEIMVGHMDEGNGNSIGVAVLQFSRELLYSEAKEGGQVRVHIGGACSHHTSFVAEALNAMTIHDGRLVDQVVFLNDDGDTHVLPRVNDTSLASQIPRHLVDPAVHNRRFEIENADIIGKNETTDLGIEYLGDNAETVAIELHSSIIPSPVINVTGEVETITGYTMRTSVVTIGETASGQPMFLGIGRDSDYRRTYIVVGLGLSQEHNSWIIIDHANNNATSRIDNGNPEECRVAADLIVQRLVV